MKLFKKLRFLLLAVTICALLPAAFSGLAPQKAAAESENLLQNFGFSGGLTYWTDSWNNGSGSDAYDASVSHQNDGSGSLKITGDEFINLKRGQYVTLTAGKKYLVSGYIKIEQMTHSGNPNCGVYFSFGDENGFACGKMNGNSDGDDWTEYRAEFVPGTTGQYSLECRMWGASGTAWFDDLSITEIVEAPVVIPDAPAPDETFMPVAVKAVRKTGLYTDFSTMNVVGALAKNVYVVADGIKTVDGTEYRRVTAFFDGKARVGYVKSSDLKADETKQIATITGTISAYAADGSICADLAAGDKIVCVSRSGDVIHTYADSRYCALYSVSAAAAEVADGGTLIDFYTLDVTITNPDCGAVTGITAGENSYPDGTVLPFTVTAKGGYAFRIAEEGGIFTRGNNAFSLTMTESATLTVEFYPILNEELLPRFAIGESPAFNGSWTSGTTTVSVKNSDSSAVPGAALRIENKTQSHATFNYTVKLLPYTTYRMTVWVRFDLIAGEAGGCGAWLMVEGNGWYFRLGQEFQKEKSAVWTKYEHDFTVSAEEITTVSFQVWGASGYAEFAGASLQPVSKTTFTKTYTAGTGGSVSTEKITGTYGETFQVLACPIEGYEFVSWSDGLTTAYRTERLDKNETLTATFRKIETQSEKAGEKAVVAAQTVVAAPLSDFTETASGERTATACGEKTATVPALPEIPAEPSVRETKNVVFPKKIGENEPDLSE